MNNWLSQLNWTDIRVEHDLAEEHVLEGQDGLGVVDRVKALESFIKVGIGRFKIFLFCMQDACVCVCVCMCMHVREGDREGMGKCLGIVAQETNFLRGIPTWLSSLIPMSLSQPHSHACIPASSPVLSPNLIPRPPPQPRSQTPTPASFPAA